MIKKQPFISCYECKKNTELLEGAERVPTHIFHKENCIVKKENEEENKIKNQEQPKRHCIVEYMITDEEVEARLESRRLSPFITRADQNTARIVIENRLRRKQKDFESVRDFLEELQIAKEEPEKEKELNRKNEWIFENLELLHPRAY